MMPYFFIFPQPVFLYSLSDMTEKQHVTYIYQTNTLHTLIINLNIINLYVTKNVLAIHVIKGNIHLAVSMT